VGPKTKGLAFYHLSFCNCATTVAPIWQCILQCDSYVANLLGFCCYFLTSSWMFCFCNFCILAMCAMERLLKRLFQKPLLLFFSKVKDNKGTCYQQKIVMFVFVVIEVWKHIVHCSHFIPHLQGIEYLLDPNCVTQLGKSNDYFT
jgi:hypothetical protein